MASVAMTVTQDIKNRLDAIELIGETVNLHRSGSSYIGFCPFHDNKNTPAFVVWPATGTWKCFGACSAGGDVFAFLMKKEGWDFGETLQYLARRAGVELHSPTPRQQEKEEKHERLYKLLTLAANFYQHQIRNTSAAHAARDHLAQRGLSEEICEEFGLGYAPDSWDAGLTVLGEKGYGVEDLLAAGLIVQKENGATFDRFRNRIMIPIRDQRDRITGFGARVVNPTDVPKFMNSPQTELFDKGGLLYGLDRACRSISANQAAVLVEGYMDVIAAHQAGFTNVVSPMGTVLTEKQLRLIKRYSRRIVLALDPDVAGDRATLRSLTVARETLDRESVPAFDPRGLVRNEGQLKLEIRVATLPTGMDPDELIAQDLDAWPALISQATPIVDYLISVFTAGRDLNDSKVKAEIIDEVRPIIHDVSHPVERADYQQKLARMLRVDERALIGDARRGAQPRLARQVTAEALVGREAEDQPTRAKQNELESYCLSAMVRRPDLLALTDRRLRELGVRALSSQDFTETGFQLIFGQLQVALHQSESTPADYLRDRLDGALLEELVKLLEEGQQIDVEDERRILDVLQAAIRLRARNIGVWLKELQFLEEAARELGDLEQARTYQHETLTQTRALQGIQRHLNRKTRQESVSDRLVA